MKNINALTNTWITKEHAKAAFLLHFRKDCKTIAQVEFLPTTLAKIDQVASVCGWLGCVLAGTQHTSTRGVDQYPFPDGDLSRMFQEASGSWPHWPRSSTSGNLSQVKSWRIYKQRLSSSIIYKRKFEAPLRCTVRWMDYKTALKILLRWTFFLTKMIQPSR